MLVHVTVKASSRKGPRVEETSDGYTVFVREPAIEGKANEAVSRILAKHFGVSLSRLELVRGTKSKQKIFRVS